MVLVGLTPCLGVFKNNNNFLYYFSYVSLIKLALEQAPGFMATYDQICHWIEQTFPYYKSTSNEWKVS